MKRLIAPIVALMFLFALSASLVMAQATGTTTQASATTTAKAAPATTQPAAQDAAAKQDPAAEEAAAYKAWYDANNAKDMPKALELAKAYLDKYPNGQYAAYLKTWYTKTKTGTITAALNAAVAAKNTAEVARIGKDLMASEPDNLDYALFLANQLRTLDTNFQYTADVTQYTNTSIRLIQSGKTPTAAANTPAFDKNKTLAYLDSVLASYDERNKDTDKALAHYDEAAMADPMNAGPYFNCGRLHQGRYATAAAEYQKIPEADRTAADPKPEVKAALDKVNQEADAVINCWSRFLALAKTDYKEDVKQKVMTALSDLYKYRNGSTDGLQKLIDDNKNSPTPVKMSPPVEKQPTTPAAAAEQGGGAKPAATTKKP
jgi:hypothetical protein